MKFWIVKNCLNPRIGVREVEANLTHVTGEIELTDPDYWTRRPVRYTGEGVMWFRALHDAQKRAEELRVKRIANLRKQITRLNKMKFL
jgi:hypothetical protein